MSLSQVDTFDNRVKLGEYLRTQNTPHEVVHGYNEVIGATLTHYKLAEMKSKGSANTIKFAFKKSMPEMSSEYVIAMIADTTEFQVSINTNIGKFFDTQTSIDNPKNDEESVSFQIGKIQKDYSDRAKLIPEVLVTMDLKTINKKDNGFTELTGYVTDEEWMKVHKIRLFSNERQIVIMPFHHYFAHLLETNEELYEKIKLQRQINGKPV
jgi:hypothetical protein